MAPCDRLYQGANDVGEMARRYFRILLVNLMLSRFFRREGLRTNGDGFS
ncbi:hypothetical protein FHS79_003364 [Polymorphobacter multimanifer]|uniref:Uncharacterized protein n=1 Tax=Polymorphobacter multimanifer TaxID=1070431 RepID=A0A841LDR6_9SPHN|nr:hypothetical protein [Polymorphobacter multimanifer]